MGEGREGRTPVVLVVDDDPAIVGLVGALVEGEGLGFVGAGSGEEALAAVTDGPVDLVVLDVMMPGMDGFETCRLLRSCEPDLPVIFLSARDDETSQVVGLTIGGDDYVAKPFRPRELVARIRARLRRSEGASHGLRVGPLALDPVAHRVSLLDVPLNLTPTEFRLLQELMAAGGDPVPVGDLFRRVWDAEPDASSRNTVMVHIRRLRAKLERVDASRGYVQTVWGVGYRVSGDGR